MRQKLGQHFLQNPAKTKEIASALKIQKDDAIIEIGPGHGELTRQLLTHSSIKIIAIEKDGRLIQQLKENFEFPRPISPGRSPDGRVISNSQTNPKSQNPKLEILEGDVLEILPSLIRNLKLEIGNSGYKIAGNIPFYITGRLLRTLGGLEPKPDLIVLTIQKEVALRICAKPPQMNLLSASVQFWAEPEIVDFIRKNAFRPQPDVDAAIIRLKIIPYERNLEEKYYKLAKILFKQPRKTIFNNLRTAYPDSEQKTLTILKKIGAHETSRPQNLSVSAIKVLAKMLYNER